MTYTLRQVRYPSSVDTIERFSSGSVRVVDNIVVVNKPHWRDELIAHRGYVLVEEEVEEESNETLPPTPSASNEGQPTRGRGRPRKES
jgi:hypothetical protein